MADHINSTLGGPPLSPQIRPSSVASDLLLRATLNWIVPPFALWIALIGPYHGPFVPRSWWPLLQALLVAVYWMPKMAKSADIFDSVSGGPALNKITARFRALLLGGLPSRFSFALFFIVIVLILIFLSLLSLKVIWTHNALAYLNLSNRSDGNALQTGPPVVTALVDAIFCSTAFKCMFWSLAEVPGLIFNAFPPRQLTIEPLRVSGTMNTNERRQLIVAHWTDLHLTKDDDGITLEGVSSGNQSLKDLIARFGQELSSLVDVILVTGDVTDSGSHSEWGKFFEIVPPGLMKKVVLVPGNHDVNIPDLGKLGRLHERILTPDFDKRRRLLRTAVALNKVQGDRAFVPPITPLSGFMERERENWALFSTRRSRLLFPQKHFHKQSLKYWHSMFPMVIDIPHSEFLVLVLNSVGPSTNLITNAFGAISNDELSWLTIYLRHVIKERPYILTMHHHISVPSFELSIREKIVDRAMSITNGPALLRRLTLGRPTVLFNGHRHVRYLGSITGCVQVVAGPSTTLGDDSVIPEARKPGFGLYGIVASDDAVKLKWEEWRELSKAV